MDEAKPNDSVQPGAQENIQPIEQIVAGQEQTAETAPAAEQPVDPVDQIKAELESHKAALESNYKNKTSEISENARAAQENADYLQKARTEALETKQILVGPCQLFPLFRFSFLIRSVENQAAD